MKSAKNFQQPSEKLFPQVGVKSLKVQAPHSSRQTRLFCTFVFKLYFNTPFVLFCNSNVWLLRDSHTAILVQMAFKQLNIFSPAALFCVPLYFARSPNLDNLLQLNG